MLSSPMMYVTSLSDLAGTGLFTKGQCRLTELRKRERKKQDEAGVTDCVTM